jgi:hypothetical protein
MGTQAGIIRCVQEEHLEKNNKNPEKAHNNII